ncbi:hypothetical protein HY970_03390 [Candidatus Kaiserbacteria bacterium]|nr:hypothetical protein [Candidatus Kaiserbacteria bacterium]
MRKIFYIVGASSAALFAPIAAYAHEVYVLDSKAVAQDMAAQSPNPFSAYFGNEHNFFFWAFVSFVTVSTIMAASTFHVFERALGPTFLYIKRFAHPVTRITIGLSLMSFGWYGGLFGPELSFSQLFAGGAELMGNALIVFGAAIVLGLYTRVIALMGIALYSIVAITHGTYLLTYADHLGAYLLLFLLGSGRFSLDEQFGLGRLAGPMQRVAKRYAYLAFPIMRVLFGFGIMYASIYAKYIHSQLALDVVLTYNLTEYFPFDPLFVVLGALIIEFAAGAMILLGIEIRWTALFLLFWLTLSLLYFQEALWPHIVLFGLGLALFAHGYDRYSLEGHFLKYGHREPVM